MRLLAPFLMRKAMDKMQEKMAQQMQQQQRYQQNSYQEPVKPTMPKEKKKVGEYIDYEEVE